MDIIINREGAKLTLSFEGDFAASSVPEAESCLKDNLGAADCGVSSLVLDFSNVARLSKEGLMLLLATKKKLAGKVAMSVVNVNDELYDRLDEQGVTTLIDMSRKPA